MDAAEDRSSLSSIDEPPFQQPSLSREAAAPVPSASLVAPFLEMVTDTENDETAAWVSHIIKEIWPYAANIAQSIVLEYVQPAINAAVPPGFPAAPQFTKIDIGHDAVVVERIRVKDEGSVPSKRGDAELIIEADISYDGHPDIQMTAGEFVFGVSHAKLRGRVEVLVRPLIDRIPLIGAAQVAFINRPDLDYTLTGHASLGNQSFIKSLVRGAVDDVLAQMAVLPNRVAFKTAPDIDFFLFSAQPVGVLRIAAISGKAFPATDRNPLKQAVGLSELPDVYLTLTHGSRVVKTDRVDDEADPVWKNQVFDFVMTSKSSSQILAVEAYDYDLGIGNDDFLGKAVSLVKDLVNKESVLDLIGAPEGAEPSVRLAVRWLPLSSSLRHVQHAIMSQRSDELRPNTCSSLLLTIEVDEAHNLPSKKRPYVRVQVGSHVFKTNAAYDTPVYNVEHPEFEQSFHVSLKGSVNASFKIDFQILDLYTGEMLGWAYCSLAEAVEAGPAGKQYNFALMRAQNANATLRVRVVLAAVLDDPPLWKEVAELQAQESK